MKPIVLFLLICISIHGFSTTYYVATTGNDSNTGSETMPWRTIQKAANTAIAGDIVYIKNGEYNERVILQNSGNENNYILFSNYQNDEVFINGNGISWGSSWNGLFDISDKNYIKIHGLKIINSTFAGIFLENANHIILENNKTTNTFSSGIGVWNCGFVAVDGNEVELACNNGEQECISVSNSHHCDILNNNVHHNGNGSIGGEGIDIKQGSHDVTVHHNWVHHLNERVGIYVDAWDSHTYNIDIYQNKVHNCTETGFAIASEFGGLLEHVHLFNNLSYRNKYDGFQLGGWTNEAYTGPTPIKHVSFINNTSFKNGSLANGYGFGITIDNAFAEDVIVRNNIFSENSNQIEVKNILATAQIDHNLLYGANDTAFAVFGDNYLTDDPLFVDTTTNDFHLQANSQAIDFGSILDAPTNDYDNTIRPIGIAIDLGAFEYNPTSNTNDFELSEVEIFPNPFTNKLNIHIKNNNCNAYTYRLIDTLGKLILTAQVQNTTFTIERKHLNTGLYFLKIKSCDNFIATKKIMVE